MARREKPVFLNDPQWYKDAVIYQVHVKSFYDANNDGIGDFAGLIEKLDYIADLGVNTLWLLPFYPSPRRDDGYDIAQYRGVHSDYGSLADARRFIAEAHRRGLRVITELVINHTSDQHPWFIRARHAKKGSRARDYYVWSDSDEKYQGTRIIFIDTEQSNWTWDPVAQQYYWHRFYSHQPDLNFDNPQVLREVLGVMRYWLDMGVDGLRLDAIPYLIERDGTSSENLPETHQVLKRIRAELDAHYPDRMLLAEANQWPEDTRPYFGGEDGGEGDECHMAFHFPLMPRMYMAIAQEDRYPITDILRQTPDIPANCQWAIFLRNHDELTLEMVTDDERDYLWNHYAADRRARLNLGIRRRLAPLVERDRRRIELLHSLLLSMPGTPTLYYGDEIGMGDNIYLGDRDGVRTPMQWSVDRNGGFSRADPAKLVLPPILDPLYGYQTINVEAQARDPHSLLNWMRRLLAVRSQQKAFGRGSLKMLAPSNRRILAYLREYAEGERQDSILCVANLSRAAQAVELDLASHAGKVPVEMIGGMSFPPIGELTYLLTLPPYGFYWFYLADATQMPSWHVAADERLPELPTLVVKQRLGELLQGASRNILEGETLPAYLPKRRWFAGEKGQPRLCYIVPLDEAEPRCALCEVEIDGLRYQLPLGFLDADQRGDSLPQLLALARLRRGRKVGLLTDAASLPLFARKVLAQLRAEAVIAHGDGEIQFIPAAGLAELDDIADEDVLPFSVAELRGFAANLGARLGEMHSVLAGESDDPAFGSRESDEASVQAWALRIAEQLREAGKRLSEPPRPLQGEAAEQARRLLERLPALLERLPLLARQAAGGLLIRVHGDLHLGQVLMVQGDARFIDFEGEPARSLEERRQRHSPMKDVGGMLRSFDYAAAMVLRNAQSTDSSEQADSARRKVAMRYRSEARDAFLVGYRAAAAGLAHAWHGREGEGAALALAGLEKAAYELLYEADYRPDWLEVPLAGLAELTEHLLKGKNR